jgi:hypothetical protein
MAALGAAALQKINCPVIKNAEELPTFEWKVRGLLNSIDPALGQQFFTAVEDLVLLPENIVIADAVVNTKYRSFEGSAYVGLQGDAADISAGAGCNTFVTMFRALNKSWGKRNEVDVDASWDSFNNAKWSPSVETFDIWLTKKQKQARDCTPTYILDAAHQNRMLNKCLSTLLPKEYEQKMSEIVARGRNHPFETNSETIRQWTRIKSHRGEQTEVQGTAYLAEESGVLSKKGKQQIKSMMQSELHAYFSGGNKFPNPGEERTFKPAYDANKKKRKGQGKGGGGGNRAPVVKKKQLKNPDLICVKCGGKGHEKATCYELFPPPWLKRRQQNKK